MGKLATWLRIMGYDTIFFEGTNDAVMVARALKENRIILTRDTRIMERGLITSGRVKAMFIASDEPEEQLRQVIDTLQLDCDFKPFTICLECNQPLAERTREEVKDRVPPYVLKTQPQYMECPRCHRIYWRGTHWTAMTDKLRRLVKCSTEK